MTDLIKAMNPTAPLTTEDVALAAARVSAVGMVIGAINQAVAGWYASTPEAVEAAGRMVEQFTGQAPDPAALAQQSQIGLGMTGAFVVLQLVLAFVQWRKPNQVLPILFLVLVIWGLGGALISIFAPAFSGGQPMWLTVFTLVALSVAAIMHVAAIRGASALDKIRTNAAKYQA
ncbi:MAG: hypothetical protein PSV23_11480 [Brevundimonas sp.]|uniref:hypothetical protein n=1 Tax=Brevundimonas sp. TaxID=1871086 RepID=UPI002489C246|nr:hypothetical protein [Brevundimonas sp.]MDI1327407.1 hypothetical protein [Brevundimonas sp.]